MLKRKTFDEIFEAEGAEMYRNIVFSSKGNLIIGFQRIYQQDGDRFLVLEPVEELSEDPNE